MINKDLVTFEEVRNVDNLLENLYIRVERHKCFALGQADAGKLLIDLQVRKSTADGAGARDFYTKLTAHLPGWDGEIQDVVLESASQDDDAAQHFRREWPSGDERIPLDTRRCH